MEFLFVSPTTLKAKTIIGGNVDNDKIVYIISDVQNTTILPLLGQELYDLISLGAEDDTLTGLHLELYTKFVQPITKFQTVANYVMISNYMVDNGGSVIHSSETSTPMTMDELNVLSSTYSGMADTYIHRFEDWITINHIEEYKTAQDGVDAIKGINNRGGWFFGTSNVEDSKHNNY